MRLKYGTGPYLTIFTVMALATPLRAYVLSTLWAWFVVPLGPHPLSLPHAYGLSVIVMLTTITMPQFKDADVIAAAGPEVDATSKQKAVYVARHIVHVLLTPLLALLFGWAARSLM